MLAPAVSGEDAPPPPPASRRRKRKNRKKPRQRQAAKLSPNAARSLKDRPLRGAGDAPMQNRPPGKKQTAKRPPRPVDGGGRLKFEAAEGEQPPASDGKQSADVRNAMKKRHARRFALDAAQPAATEPRPSRLMDDGGGRLRFERAEDDAAPVSDAEQSEEAKRAARKRQVMDHAADEAAQGSDVDSTPQTAEPQIDPHAKAEPASRRGEDHAAQPEGTRLRFEDTPPCRPDGESSNTPEDSPALTRRQQKRFNKAERRVEDSSRKLEKAQSKIPVKRRVHLQKQYDSETGKVRRRLQFEKEAVPEGAKPALPKRAGGAVLRTAGTTAVFKAHGKVWEAERENVGVEAAHKGEFLAERGAGRFLRWNRNRLRSKPYRAVREAERRLAMDRTELEWQTALRDHPELRRKNALSRLMQKQKLKRKYAQAAKEAKQTTQFTQNVVNATGQTVRAAAQQAVARKSLLAVVAILAFVAVFFSAGLTACTTMLSGFQSSYISASYLANEQDICNSELYYTEMETDLQIDIDKTEENYPGYDEYRYNIGEISHNPYELMGYLSTVYNAFTFEQVKAEIARLFGEQYQLTREVIVETRYDGNGDPYDWYVLQTTLTVTPLSQIISNNLTPGEQTDRYGVYQQTLGNRQAFGNPFDFPWRGYVSSGYGWRVHPISGEKNLHRGVDIAVAEGTPIKAVHDGRVVSAGDTGGYGLCVVIEDEKGYQSRYAHCSSLSVSMGQEVKRGDVIAAVGNTGNSTGPHLHLEVMLDGEYLNPYYFVDVGEDGTGSVIPGAPGGLVIPDYPGEAPTDETFAAMLAEAEKYLGYPYVWGGSSPSTSFDCSGFVSWVINHSGWNVGRLGAQGLFNICTPVSTENVQPGDLIFFWHTYDAPNPNGVTHVGIYIGNGQMIHCGNPISYANVNSSYWQSHFYSYARLP